MKITFQIKEMFKMTFGLSNSGALIAVFSLSHRERKREKVKNQSVLFISFSMRTWVDQMT